MKRAKGDFSGLLLSNQTHRSSSNGKALLPKTAPGVRITADIGFQPSALQRFTIEPHRTDGVGASYQPNVQLGG